MAGLDVEAMAAVGRGPEIAALRPAFLNPVGELTLERGEPATRHRVGGDDVAVGPVRGDLGRREKAPRDLRIPLHHENLQRPHPGVNIEGDERLELRNDLFGWWFAANMVGDVPH